MEFRQQFGASIDVPRGGCESLRPSDNAPLSFLDKPLCHRRPQAGDSEDQAFRVMSSGTIPSSRALI